MIEKNVKRNLSTYYSSLSLLEDRTVLLLCVSNVLDRMSESILVPLLPIYAVRLGLNPLLLGVMFALLTATRAVASAPCGYLADRYGKRPFIACGMIIGALSIITLGFVTDPVLILALRALDGVAAGMRNAPTTTYLGDISDDETRPQVLSVYQSTGTLDATIGPAFGGIIAAVGSFSVPFVLLGGCTLLGGSLLAAFLPSIESESENRRLRPKISLGAVRGQSSPLFIALTLSALLSGLGLGATSPIIAPLLQETIGAGSAYMGMFWSLFSISLTVVMPVGGSLVNSFGKRRGVLVGKTIWTAVIVVVGSVHIWFVPPLLYMLGAVGSAFSGPALGTIRYETAPDGNDGTVLGVYSTFSSVGHAIGPLASGAIASAMSYQAAYLSVAVVWGLDVLVLASAFVVGETTTSVKNSPAE
ncbi:MFS transporter [Haladaptatus sp. DFWS20]|uniref:MFS transporter n=1 Tax=Haladaptatus sp. DFWS20 TaxID=3403467 RepID=UPI003EBA6F3B